MSSRALCWTLAVLALQGMGSPSTTDPPEALSSLEGRDGVQLSPPGIPGHWPKSRRAPHGYTPAQWAAAEPQPWVSSPCGATADGREVGEGSPPHSSAPKELPGQGPPQLSHLKAATGSHALPLLGWKYLPGAAAPLCPPGPRCSSAKPKSSHPPLQPTPPPETSCSLSERGTSTILLMKASGSSEVALFMVGSLSVCPAPFVQSLAGINPGAPTSPSP